MNVVFLCNSQDNEGTFCMWIVTKTPSWNDVCALRCQISTLRSRAHWLTIRILKNEKTAKNPIEKVTLQDGRLCIAGILCESLVL